MAHLNLYLPDELARKLNERARKEKKSLSGYLTDLARRDLESPLAWQAFVESTSGSWVGEFPEREKFSYEERDGSWLQAAEPGLQSQQKKKRARRARR